MSGMIGNRGWFFGLISGVTGVLMLVSGLALGEMPSAMMSDAESKQRPLQFGLLPYVSTRKLFAVYTPMKRYLEKTLKRSVRMSTAPDFATYIERARRGEYDLYHTAPHFAA